MPLEDTDKFPRARPYNEQNHVIKLSKRITSDRASQ